MIYLLQKFVLLIALLVAGLPATAASFQEDLHKLRGLSASYTKLEYRSTHGNVSSFVWFVQKKPDGMFGFYQSCKDATGLWAAQAIARGYKVRLLVGDMQVIAINGFDPKEHAILEITDTEGNIGFLDTISVMPNNAVPQNFNTLAIIDQDGSVVWNPQKLDLSDHQSGWLTVIDEYLTLPGLRQDATNGVFIAHYLYYSQN